MAARITLPLTAGALLAAACGTSGDVPSGGRGGPTRPPSTRSTAPTRRAWAILGTTWLSTMTFWRSCARTACEHGVAAVLARGDRLHDRRLPAVQHPGHGVASEARGRQAERPLPRGADRGGARLPGRFGPSDLDRRRHPPGVRLRRRRLHEQPD